MLPAGTLTSPAKPTLLHSPPVRKVPPPWSPNSRIGFRLYPSSLNRARSHRARSHDAYKSDAFGDKEEKFEGSEGPQEQLGCSSGFQQPLHQQLAPPRPLPRPSILALISGTVTLWLLTVPMDVLAAVQVGV